ncbi:MAG: NAD(P)/FAD-dependent oxidoreductase [bacterium]|nr:NAD(P)/FAD-dependent oxidoreductase [bacterium]
MSETVKIIVVGAGAAGMLAAGRAADLGAEVVLLEKMRQVGRKIRISGKGRCNLTNTLPTGQFIKHFGKDGRFLRQSFARFFSDDLLNFLHSENLPTKVERGGRVFPESDSAVDVARTLEHWVEKQGVEIIRGARVRGLDTHEGRINGVHYDLFSEDGVQGSGGQRGNHQLQANVVMLATGGMSYPSTGSSGDGYKLAQELGHTIIKPRPSLVPLCAPGAPPEGIHRLSLRNIEGSLWIEGKLVRREFGELNFIETGLSGPIILELSRIAVDAIDAGKKLELSIDLKPALDHKKLDARLVRDLANREIKTWRQLLDGLMPRKLVPVAVSVCGVPEETHCSQINGKQRKTLLKWLKDFRFQLNGYGDFKEAIVTKGGVDTSEVNPKTLESKLIPGLYLLGELLNVDADTGGFNMMSAFSTGWVAGESAALPG